MNRDLFRRRAGVDLDVGCGANKQPGWLGMDYMKGQGVDVVWNIERTPWKPVPTASCRRVLMSHVLEHVDPRHRFAVLDECWRILQPGGQLMIACPLANSILAHGHLEHYPCPNEMSFQFFDPDYPLWHTRLPKAKPWKLLRNDAMPNGCIEVVMEPRKDAKGKICLPAEPKFRIKSESNSSRARRRSPPAQSEPRPRKTPVQQKFGEAEVTIVKSGANGNPRHRLLIVTPTLGKIRAEWAVARYNMVTPCNWSANSFNIGCRELVPMHYLVADAQNIAVKTAIEEQYEWLLLIEDDVVPPLDGFLVLNEYMVAGEYPVVSGLYFTKGIWSEPIVYRGRGNSAFHDWKLGDRIMADGVPTGFLLIHGSVLRVLWEDSPEYDTIGGIKTRRVFETPSKIFVDPIAGPQVMRGTSDLFFCGRILSEKVLGRAGWPKLEGERHPFVCDSRILCQHIDFETGTMYPGAVPARYLKGKSKA